MSAFFASLGVHHFLSLVGVTASILPPTLGSRLQVNLYHWCRWLAIRWSSLILYPRYKNLAAASFTFSSGKWLLPCFPESATKFYSLSSPYLLFSVAAPPHLMAWDKFCSSLDFTSFCDVFWSAGLGYWS